MLNTAVFADAGCQRFYVMSVTKVPWGLTCSRRPVSEQRQETPKTTEGLERGVAYLTVAHRDFVRQNRDPGFFYMCFHLDRATCI